MLRSTKCCWVTPDTYTVRISRDTFMLTRRNDKAPLLRYVQVCVLSTLSMAFLSVINHEPKAHEGATGIVKERMDAMSEMACAMRLVADMVKGRRELEPRDTEVLAQTITAHAAEIPSLFPDTQDSREGRGTEARSSIWDRWTEFVSRAQRLEEQGERLGALARVEDESAVEMQFKTLGKSCRSCHKDFRRKKKKRRASSSGEDCSAALLHPGR